VVADGQGGAFIAGGFTRVAGQSHRFLAHMLANGRVDRSWRPALWSRVRPQDTQPVLVIRDGVLFVSGLSRRPRGRTGIVAITANTGLVDSKWGRGLRVDGGEPMLVWRRHLYVAGTVIQGHAFRTGIAALDAATGRFAKGFNAPPLVGGEGTGVNALLLSSGVLFVGGKFVRAGNHRVTSLLAMNPGSGRVEPGWVPHLSPCSECIGFAVVYGLAPRQSGIYIAAAARRVDGRRRAGGALVDASTGSVLPWAPQFSGQPEEVVLAGDRVYAGGDFTAVDNAPRHEFAALDPTSGQLLASWQPAAATDAVLAMATDGHSVFVGTIERGG
jgi:outer membrane protein assembly factor BamB